MNNFLTPPPIIGMITPTAHPTPAPALPRLGVCYALDRTSLHCMAYRAIVLMDDIGAAMMNQNKQTTLANLIIKKGARIGFGEACDYFPNLIEANYQSG